MKDRDLFGAPINWDGRRGRVVTRKNIGTSYTPEQRRAEQDRWWDEHMEEVFPQFAQDLINARAAAVASRSGLNVVDIGPEMTSVESIGALRKAFLATKGLAITSEELVDRLVKEARRMEERSNIPHLGPQLTALAVREFAVVRGLSSDKSNELLRRANQRRLPGV